ncbi:hypothetical protein [Raoultella ornithinolytica]|uniref:hypothetical protein n=1 Tax=Raoultella ornithinolytica TaxID=54291 RepID=UPI001F46EB3A|nr:hypothetical protein [Raoultella ornithinolytica]MCF6704403.1 hypothetical protein [Raoultella ornithinolytica]
MTSKLTRERLQEIAEDGFLKHGESKELARMALAAMDSEPVCFVSERNLATLTKYRAAVKVKAEPVMVRPVALYRHAQPAPVVPEEMPTYAISPYSGAEYEAGYRDGWNACRAAMLQGAENAESRCGNSPVIPDGWTGNDKANAALMMLDRIETVDPVDDDRIDGIKHIIHELAAAPQEVKGE